MEQEVKTSKPAPAPREQAQPPAAPPQEQPQAPAVERDLSTQALGPYVDEDGQVAKPEPTGEARTGVIPMDLDDVPEALR